MARKSRIPKRLLIAGRWWRIIVDEVPQSAAQRNRRNVGLCDYNSRTIWISKRLNPGNQYATLLHEIVHAAAPTAPEKEVMACERALCSALNHLLG